MFPAGKIPSWIFLFLGLESSISGNIRKTFLKDNIIILLILGPENSISGNKRKTCYKENIRKFYFSKYK